MNRRNDVALGLVPESKKGRFSPATANELVYSTYANYDGTGGIFRTTVGAGEKPEVLVPLSAYDAENAHDIEWLPDGSGFLFAKHYVYHASHPAWGSAAAPLGHRTLLPFLKR